jgi:hypothetical protein
MATVCTFPLDAHGLAFEVMLLDGPLNEDGEATFGCVNHYDHTIQISAAPNDTRARATLLHELVHLVEEAFPGDAKHEELTEGQVTRIANGLFALFAANRKVAEWIVGACDLGSLVMEGK